FDASRTTRRGAPSAARDDERVSAERRPLLGRRVDSPFIDGALFETLLDEHRPTWLGDHRIGGTCVVPAAALIEMAVSACRETIDLHADLELLDAAIHRA